MSKRNHKREFPLVGTRWRTVRLRARVPGTWCLFGSVTSTRYLREGGRLRVKLHRYRIDTGFCLEKMIKIQIGFIALMLSSAMMTVSGEETADDCAAEDLGSYDLNFHVGGLFIVMAVSSLGIFSVLFLGERVGSAVLTKVFQVVKMFGIGVIISTAWIHLLPDAFESFSSPCLKGRWSSYGTNYVGLFALTAAFLIHLIEYYSICRTTEEEEQCVDCNAGFEEEDSKSPSKKYLGQDEEKCDSNARDGVEKTASSHANISIIIVEVGLLVHSVIIGVDLGVSDDDTFYTLLIAICFHQLFEGIAIGSLLISTTLSFRVKTLMSLFYPITTPAGVAVGIVVRHSYNENSQGLILAQGICNSLAAGLLMYSGYCQLVGGEINQSVSFKKASRTFKLGCFFAMYLGAGAMALLGLWA